MTSLSFLSEVPTPSYVIDLERLEKNLKTLRQVADDAACRVLLAQKAYSAYDTYSLISRYLDGTAASGVYEARLGAEFMPEREVHVFSPAYRDDEFVEILGLSHTIVFNSFSQWQHFKPLIDQHMAAERKPISCGLRINPLYSEVDVEIYNPASPGSRLGVTLEQFMEGMLNYGLDGLEGLHFHALCEDSAETLERTLAHVYKQYLPFIEAWPRGLKWFNLGGGHHITRKDYNISLLVDLLRDARERTGADIYIEPGEAVALNAGYLVSSVLDTGKNELDFAILDTSVVCHMPDVLEMPYRPRCHVLYQDGREAEGAPAGEAAYTYRLGGPTCLAGDVVGDYAFPDKLHAGDRLIFHDMAIYTMVKTNTFNGMPLPSIVTYDKGEIEVLRTFGYDDFKMRLGSY